MIKSQTRQSVLLDLNNPVFQKSLFLLDKTERNCVIDTLQKLRQLTWDQVYRDAGLKWEKITSVAPPKNIDALYSLRITQARRATAYLDGQSMRFQLFSQIIMPLMAKNNSPLGLSL